MRLLCFGDSNTYGYDPRSYSGDRYPSSIRWVDQLARDTGWDILPGGQNGRTIPSAAQAPFLPQAEALVVMLGSNDLLQGLSSSEVSARMESFLRPLLIAFDFILLVAPPPMKRGAWVTEGRLLIESAQLAAHYRALSDRLGIAFTDAGLWNVELTFDGVHFSEVGHHAFAEGIRNALLAPQFHPIHHRSPQLLERLTSVWDTSVRATHPFLTEADIQEIATYVPNALRSVSNLAVIRNRGIPVGFLGVDGIRLEMMFLSPDAIGHGLGGKFLRWGIQRYGIREVCVNEQNPEALGFYVHLGFRSYKRTNLDEQGRPFPLLYLRLEETPCSLD